MEKYSLNEGNESLKRVLLMMGYDSKKTLEENTKVIFEQNTSVENAVDADNDIDPNIVAKVSQPAAGVTPAPATPEVSLSYEDTVKKLQNLLITKYNANLGKSGADGKIGKLTLDAIANAMRTKFAKQPPTPTDDVNKSTTPATKDDETITPEDKPETTIQPETTPAVNPGSVDDWK
jgi:hypothetical protein